MRGIYHNHGAVLVSQSVGGIVMGRGCQGERWDRKAGWQVGEPGACAGGVEAEA